MRQRRPKELERKEEIKKEQTITLERRQLVKLKKLQQI